MAETPTNPMNEIDAMKEVADAISKLDRDATGRVLRWAFERFGLSAAASPVASRPQPLAAGATAPAGEPAAATPFAGFADLYHATTPKTDVDRALVAGYWFQYVLNQADFTGQSANTELKNLGHGVGNVTSAFDNLKAQRPALVMQVRKDGTTKQARKKYKLTLEGKKAVEAMVQAS
jgi:hypothetical protein